MRGLRIAFSDVGVGSAPLQTPQQPSATALALPPPPVQAHAPLCPQFFFFLCGNTE